MGQERNNNTQSNDTRGEVLKVSDTKGTYKDSIRYHTSGKRKRTYASWKQMRTRCFNPNNKDWHNYGGRGIEVCSRWESYEHFHADMGEAPEGQTLDRIDSNGNYEPNNCRWANALTQGKNSRQAKKITHNGETDSVRGWALRLGVSPDRLYSRFKRGWSVEKALTHGI